MTIWKRIGRFQAVSVLGMAVQLLALGVLVERLGVGYLPATVLAVGAALVHNFAWHQRWTWRGRVRGPAAVRVAFTRFVAANGSVSLLGNVVVMAVLAGGAGVQPVPANIAAIAACGLLNFWLGDRVVFRPSHAGSRFGRPSATPSGGGEQQRGRPLPRTL